MKGDANDLRTRRRRIAVCEQDFIHARFIEKRVDKALALIAKAREKYGRICVSFSGGKDSTVLVDLVRRVDSDAQIVWFDSGAELESTRNLCKEMGAITILPKMSVVDVWLTKGYGGAKAIDRNAKLDLNEILIHEPSRRALQMTDSIVSAIGLRAMESARRLFSAKAHGEFHQYENGKYRLCPLLWWSAADIWAYIASREIKYNEAYDKLTALGVPRNHQRVSTILDGTALQYGRYAYLKKIDPNAFNRLTEKFPKLRSYT